MNPEPNFPICPKTIRLTQGSTVTGPDGKPIPPQIQFAQCLGGRCMAFKQAAGGVDAQGNVIPVGVCAEGLVPAILDVIAQHLEGLGACCDAYLKANNIPSPFNAPEKREPEKKS